MTHIIRIENWHPTPLNRLINSHWAQASRMKDGDVAMIGTYGIKAGIPKASGKRSMELIISYGKGQRSCDPDAYYKSTNDALVRLGYLKNDSNAWLDLKPVTYRRGEMYTEIRLEDL